MVKFLKGLSRFARVILFDKRGTGLSDRVTELSTLEERMDDIRAVMDDVGSQKAVLFGHSEGGSVCALFAATYPMRTSALITFGVFAKRRYSPEYPWAPKDEERQVVYDMIEQNWGSGEMDLASLAPSMASNSVFMSWLSDYFRSGASPSAALVLTKMNTEVDIIDILDTINVPTLLLYRTNDIDVKIEEGRFIAEKIKGSKFIEFEGNDHLFWVGNTEEVLDEITEFVTGARPDHTNERLLSTILFTQIVDETYKLSKMGESAWSELVLQHEKIIRRLIQRYRGKAVRHINNTFLATFDGPSKAVHCAIDIREAMRVLDLELKYGIHTGELLVSSDQNISGMAIHVAAKIQGTAQANEILVSQTVKNLSSGSGIDFKQKGSVSVSELEDPVIILAVEEDQTKEETSDDISPIPSAAIPQNHSFLEDVLQSIEKHLGDEHYGIDRLCLDVGVSERQLQRKLKSIANKSPNQMIRSVRLHRAKDMIVQKGEGISEAAYNTGFNSLSYFTKCFKREFGLAPTDFLKNVKER